MGDQMKILGWREWVELPDMGLGPIKAKVDTGARTSCLHAFELQAFEKDGQPWIRFKVHPVQKSESRVVECEAPITDQRPVTDSGGHTEQRYVISTRLGVGDWVGEVEMTLTGRDNMLFRMLIGRTTIEAGGFVVNPALSYQTRRKGTKKPDRS
ncbi:MAG: ATP-dependent zinc protease [Sedimenticolaceae bacterium]